MIGEQRVVSVCCLLTWHRAKQRKQQDQQPTGVSLWRVLSTGLTDMLPGAPEGRAAANFLVPVALCSSNIRARECCYFNIAYIFPPKYPVFTPPSNTSPPQCLTSVDYRYYPVPTRLSVRAGRVLAVARAAPPPLRPRRLSSLWRLRATEGAPVLSQSRETCARRVCVCELRVVNKPRHEELQPCDRCEEHGGF